MAGSALGFEVGLKETVEDVIAVGAPEGDALVIEEGFEVGLELGLEVEVGPKEGFSVTSVLGSADDGGGTAGLAAVGGGALPMVPSETPLLVFCTKMTVTIMIIKMKMNSPLIDPAMIFPRCRANINVQSDGAGSAK